MKEIFNMTGEQSIASSVIERVRVMAEEEGKCAKTLTRRILEGDYNDMVATVEQEFGHRVAVLAETR